MIGKIKGKVNEIFGNIGLIETQSGVFYEVYLAPDVLSSSPIGSLLEVYTYLHFSEDGMILFGFKEKKQYDIFKLLLKVSGVGPKTAFSIISFIKFEDIIKAIKTNDVSILTQVPGLGKKTAMKIILDLSSKIDADFDLKNMILSQEDKMAIEALISLGFSSKEVKNIVMRLPKNLKVEEKITEALKKLKSQEL